MKKVNGYESGLFFTAPSVASNGRNIDIYALERIRKEAVMA
jgi:hypothetical protein